MFELGMFILADAAAVLTAAYWGGLIIGGGLLVVSVLGGGDSDAGVDGDADFDFDVDADVDFDADFDLDTDGGFDLDADVAEAAHAAHGGATALATWFSMRFVVFFLAVFGAVGVILTSLMSVGMVTSFVISLIAGVLVGQAVHQMFRQIRRTSGDSTPRPQDYVRRLARVTIAIAPPGKGEVALQVRGSRRFVPAVTDETAARLNVGEEVVVVAYRAGVARVITRADFERKYRSEEGGMS